MLVIFATAPSSLSYHLLLLPPVKLCSDLPAVVKPYSTAIPSRSTSYFPLSYWYIVKWGKNRPYCIPSNSSQRRRSDNYICILLWWKAWTGTSPSKLLTRRGYNSYRTNHATWNSHSVIDEWKSGTYHKFVQIPGSLITAFITHSLLSARSSSLSQGPSCYPSEDGIIDPKLFTRRY